MPERIDQSQTWEKLSPNAKNLAFILSQAVGVWNSLENIENSMLEKEGEIVDIESALDELTLLGVIEETNILKEKEARLKELGRGRRISSSPGKYKGLGEEYKSLFREVQIMRNDDNPKWTLPKWRLKEEYTSFANSDELEG